MRTGAACYRDQTPSSLLEGCFIGGVEEAMKQKIPFKNMPKVQAKKFAHLRREKTRLKLARVIRRRLRQG